MPYVVAPNLFASSFSWSCPSRVYRDKQLFFNLATLSRQDFLKSLEIFCHDKKLLSRDRLFFSGSCHLLSCLSRHRIICCDTIALAILKSSSIYVATYFSLVAIESYHSLAFIVATENFFVATQVLAATLDFIATRISLFPFFLCCPLASCYDRKFISFMFCLSRQK